MLNINEEELQCKICYEFLSETVLCIKCSNAFCQKCALNYKNKAKKYGRIDKCPMCGSGNFTFQRSEEIDKLVKRRKHKPMKCIHCKRIIFNKEEYEEHVLICKYKCKFCGILFDRENDLLRHIKNNNEELIRALELMNENKTLTKRLTLEKMRKSIKKKILKKEPRTCRNFDEEKSAGDKKNKKFIKGLINSRTKTDSFTFLKNYNDDKDIGKIVEKSCIKTKIRRIPYKEIKKLNNSNIIQKDKIYKSKKVNNSEKKNLKHSVRDENNFEYKYSTNLKEIEDKNIIKKLKNNCNTNNKEFLNNESQKEDSRNKNAFSHKDFNLLSDSGKKCSNIQAIDEEEKINAYTDYLNSPVPESKTPDDIPDGVILNTTYDLFFCGQPNNIECLCCEEQICQPGSCMCVSCMKINKKYHMLKTHYLINKSGRACKYSHGSFHCYCYYSHIASDDEKNNIKPICRCQGQNSCKPCQEITLLMGTYLSKSICQKLLDREQSHM